MLISVSSWLEAHTDPLHNPWSGDHLQDTTELGPCPVRLDPLHGREQEVAGCDRK